MEKIIWGVDPGSSICGLCRLDSGLIGDCFNVEPNKVYREILSRSKGSQFIVAIEDIFPYSLKLTPSVIDTCKLIGELTYRFNTCKQVDAVKLVARNSIKKFIYDSVPDECIPRINKKILDKHNRNIKQEKKGLIKLNGEMRLPSFNWVDDRIVIAALKSLLNIPTPKPGKPNIFGLKSHSWNALAVAYFVHIGSFTNEKQ